MIKPCVVILSGSGYNLGIAKALRAGGIAVVIVDRREEPELLGDVTLRNDVTDFCGILRQLNDAKVGRVLGAYTSADIAVATMNRLNAYYTGNSVHDSMLPDILSKSTMVRKWKEAGLFNRISRSYRDFDPEIVEFNWSYTTLIKPDNSSSSRGVTILPQRASRVNLESAFALAANHATNATVLVEEFIEGTEYTVEMIGDAMGNVSVYAVSIKYHTQNTNNNRIAVKLHYNADIVPDDKQSRIADFAAACYRAFGLRSSLGHLELLERPNGSLVPVEINSRSAGYIACPLVDVASGRNFFLDYLAVLRGARIENTFYRSNNSAVYFFYDMPVGITSIREANLLEFLDTRISSLYYNRSRLRANTTYDLLTCDNDRVGYEILAGDRSVLTTRHLMDAERKFLGSFFGSVS